MEDKLFEEPEFKVIAFDSGDVIVASGITLGDSVDGDFVDAAL